MLINSRCNSAVRWFALLALVARMCAVTACPYLNDLDGDAPNGVLRAPENVHDEMARLEAIGVEQMKPYMDVAAWHALTADDRPKLKAAEDAFLSVHKICQAHPYDISDQRSWQALIGIRVAAGLGALLDGNMQQARVLMNAVKANLDEVNKWWPDRSKEEFDAADAFAPLIRRVLSDITV